MLSITNGIIGAIKACMKLIFFIPTKFPNILIILRDFFLDISHAFMKNDVY